MNRKNYTQSIPIEKKTNNTHSRQKQSDQTNIASRRRGI
jgi:hypothetical protein